MARGRFLSKSLSDSPDFNLALSSDFSRLLWMMLVTHLDVEGRFWAEPRIISAKVLPWRADVTLDQVEEALGEYEDLGFIVRYRDSKGLKVLQDLNFADDQRGLRKDRELASVFPPPPPELLPGSPAEPTPDAANNGGTAPDRIRIVSGAKPEVILLKGKAKGQAKGKAKGQAASIRSPPAAAALRELLEQRGLRGNKLAALLADDWITPDRVHACWHAILGREDVRNPVGLLVAMLEDHDEPPDRVGPAGAADNPRRYITGKYSQYIQH